MVAFTGDNRRSVQLKLRPSSGEPAWVWFLLRFDEARTGWSIQRSRQHFARIVGELEQRVADERIRVNPDGE